MMQRRAVACLFLMIIFIAACNDDAISRATMDNGKKVYDRYCLGCHMENAMGVPGLNPPLVNSDLLLKDKAKSIRVVLKGSEELKGEPKTGYRNTMASLINLSDEEIADVLTFARNSFGNKASAVSSTEVKTERANLK